LIKDSNFFAINFLIYISKTRQTILAEEKLTSLQIRRRMYRIGIRIPVIFHFLLIEFRKFTCENSHSTVQSLTRCR